MIQNLYTKVKQEKIVLTLLLINVIAISYVGKHFEALNLPFTKNSLVGNLAIDVYQMHMFIMVSISKQITTCTLKAYNVNANTT